MIVYNKFVESKKEPLNKRDIWFDGKYTYLYKEGEWKAFTLPIESVDEIKEILQKEDSILESKLLEYLKISDSPFEKGSGENSAVLKGGENISNNENEVAFGKYNKSNNNTIHSVDIGTSESNRKNAHEIMQDGKHYIYGVGGYDGTNPNDSKDLADIINNKAEIDNYYPNMSVGFADDLVGRGESVPAEFSFRASGGKSIKDGTAWVKRLRGNSVVWNQKVAKTYMNKDDILYNIDVIPQNHKFALIRSKAFGNCYYMPSVDVYDYVLTGGEYAKIFVQSNVADAEYSLIYSAAESGYVQLIDLTQMFGAGNEPTTIEEFYARKPIVEDEYAYNEGIVLHMTADGIKSVGDNAFNKDKAIRGEVDADGIFTPNAATDRFAYLTRCLPNEVYYFYDALNGFLNYTCYFYDASMQLVKADIVYQGDKENAAYGEITSPDSAFYMRIACHQDYLDSCFVTLVHSGWKQDTDAKYQPYWEDRLIFDGRIKEHFQNGMQKWDAVYNKNGKGYIVKGTGVLDLGELEWNSIQDGHFYTPDVLGNIGYMQLICARYTTAVGKFGDMENDKTIGNNMEYPYNMRIFVRDDAYTDAATFKAAMAGVLLYYQLAEPIIIEYDEPFNLDYRVADFGTEQMLTEQPSAPIAADIIYQFNAVDMIREHELEITKLQNIIAAMQEQLINLNNNI